MNKEYVKSLIRDLETVKLSHELDVIKDMLFALAGVEADTDVDSLEGDKLGKLYRGLYNFYILGVLRNSSCTKVSMNKEEIYHACRVAFLCGEDEIPWHMVCHALRQGLGFADCITYTVTEKDFKKYPYLRELIHHLERCAA